MAKSMPTNPTEAGWALGHQAGSWGLGRVTKHFDTILDRFLPKMPETSGPPPLPAFLTGAGGAVGTGLATQDLAKSVPPAQTFPGAPIINESSEARQSSPMPSETSLERLKKGGFSYASDEMDTAVACIPCTRGHLSAMTVASAKAAESAAQGDDYHSRLYLARMQAEAMVLHAYDWTPEKMGRAPEKDRAVIESIQPCVGDAVDNVPSAPPELVSAWGALDEAVRFARSTSPTEADREEIRIRVQDAEAHLNFAERQTLAPGHRESILSQLSADQQEEAESARDILRTARHRLTTSDIYSVNVLESVASQLEQATVALTPVPTANVAQEAARQCKSCRDTFYTKIFSKEDPR